MGVTNLDSLTLADDLIVNGISTQVGVQTFTAVPVFPVGGVTLGTTTVTEAEIGVIDGVTPGTQAASKALVPDANLELDGLGVIKVADTLIASAAVLTLNSVPVELVAAPGVGTSLEFVGAVILLDFNSVAFDFAAGEDLQVQLGAVAVSNDLDSLVVNGGADVIMRLVPWAEGGTAPPEELVDNTALNLAALSGDAAAGNSALKVRCYYREVRLASLEAIA